MEEGQVFQRKNVHSLTVEGELRSAPPTIIALLKVNSKIFARKHVKAIICELGVKEATNFVF